MGLGVKSQMQDQQGLTSMLMRVGPSWAPQASLGRRSVSGIAIFYRGCLIKGISRVQGCVSLSSCEAELRSIPTAVQESEGIATLIEQLANRKMELVLHTDSSSAKAVLLNRGLSRRVRHLDIAVCYLQERIQEAGSLKVVWCPTSAMVADILTKCLGLELFGRHQGALGIIEDETVQRVQMICGFKLDGSDFDEGLDFERIFELCDESDVGQRDCEASVDRNSFCSSSGSDRIPALGSIDQSLEMTTAGQSQEVGAPFWCKTCKWLFKNEDSYGLTQAKEGYVCGKCKNESTVTGSAAQHAFKMREKDKTKRWGNKGEGKGSASEKAPITPAPSSAGEGDPLEMAPITPAPGWMMETVSWFSDLGSGESTPDWYKALREAVCRKGRPLRNLGDEFERLTSLLDDEEKARYDSDLESLKQQNKDLFEVLQTGDFERLIVVIDLRGQFGGQASLWEVVTSAGNLFTTVPCGISGLSLAAFICGLCYKGAVPLVLVGDTLDIGI